MGRLAIIAAVLGFGFLMANQGAPVLDGLEDKLWLVALFPGVYILGVALLKD